MVTIEKYYGGNKYDFDALSSDVKPTERVATNSKLLELDTGRFFYFDGTEWKEIGWNEPQQL